MYDDGHIPIPLGWPRGRLVQWLAALASVAALLIVFYFLFTWLALQPS